MCGTIYSRRCNLGNKKICQTRYVRPWLTASSLPTLVHCWCCFQLIVLCVQHMSLTCHGISDSISNHLTHGDTAVVSPSSTASFSIWNRKSVIRKTKTLNFFKAHMHPPQTLAADLSALLIDNTMTYNRTLQSIGMAGWFGKGTIAGFCVRGCV